MSICNSHAVPGLLCTNLQVNANDSIVLNEDKEHLIRLLASLAIIKKSGEFGHHLTL